MTFLLALSLKHKDVNAVVIILFPSYLYYFFHSLLPKQLSAPWQQGQARSKMSSTVVICYIHISRCVLWISQKQVQGLKLSHLKS